MTVITYAAPHRKTQDLLLRMKALGREGLTVAALPWRERPGAFKPLIPHRPQEALPVHPGDLARRLGYAFVETTEDELASVVAGGMAWIGGAGLLPPSAVRAGTIFNAHPAYLPGIRGLDALKWAVLERRPIGVTTHVIAEEPDAGVLVRRELVELFAWDDFHSIARRQYEKEIELLARADEDYAALEQKTILPAEGPVRRRMPHALELRLQAAVAAYLDEYFARREFV
ncbi:MAG: formyltransferase family protein [Bacteroidia bacterium]|nr:formyltransferase family protein [Bacteroidia bacterium]